LDEDAMTYDMRQLNSKVLLASMIAALASGLAACDRPPSGDSIGDSFDKSVEDVRQDLKQAANNAGRTVEKGPDKPGETFTEAGRDVKNIALAARVKAALIGARALASSKIDVGATTNGVVTLTGSAEDATTRDLAERLASSVEGVTAVRNDVAIARGS
jgi:osmotically-inducible protein OsmY